MTCGKEKPATDFYFRNKKYNRRHSECKICTGERVKNRHKENPERTRNNDLKRNYGITLDEHTQMYEEQNGVCAVCEKPGDGKWKKLCVDHDHKTGKVRQLLCRNCNMILGQVDDSINHLEKLTKYLQKHSPTHKTL
jgi:hypothetical protein